MTQPAPALIISHWYNLIENFHYSTQDYYKALEAAIQQRAVPDASNSPVEWRESGVLSAKRLYLRVKRDRYVFDICAAPFGTGFFVSWWLGELKAGNIFKLIAFLIAYAVGSVIALSIISAVLMQIFGYLIGGFFTLLCMPLLIVLLVLIIRQNPVGIEDTILEIPVIGPLYERFFCPPTYYKIDTALMFQSAVHNAVLEVMDAITKENGLRVLSEAERKPIMREFYS